MSVEEKATKSPFFLQSNSLWGRFDRLYVTDTNDLGVPLTMIRFRDSCFLSPWEDYRGTTTRAGWRRQRLWVLSRVKWRTQDNWKHGFNDWFVGEEVPGSSPLCSNTTHKVWSLGHNGPTLRGKVVVGTRVIDGSRVETSTHGPRWLFPQCLWSYSLRPVPLFSFLDGVSCHT